MKKDNPSYPPYPTYKCAVSDRAYRKFINMHAYLLSNVEQHHIYSQVMNAVIYFLVTGTVGDVDRRIMPIFEHYLPLMEKAVSRAAIARAAAARRKARDKQPTDENSSEERHSEEPKPEEPKPEEPKRKFTPGSPIEPIPVTDFYLNRQNEPHIQVQTLPKHEWPKVPEELLDDDDFISVVNANMVKEFRLSLTRT